MENNEKHHIVSYRSYFVILLLLLLFTFISIAITQIELGSYNVAGALLLATIKSGLVLYFFMHLKFDKPYLKLMVGFVMAVFIAVIVITFFDYYYR
ncbi:cytochrome C oxidase subunit IV family protein [Sunxiuqinia elliptica]|uniref:Cytochrome c oxidase subunit 4 n=1 Tax=Sunxiuqinia elliptica TaxID=655355 RepID=A0A1I2K7X2_9BACT|nr:cytochrome C oxidase subunit IV family protein [Sunxiuqinia elliptica]TDN96251.1 cytochrome c oxidase subunit 4 [Sunxiuqinia elliptica]TDO67962.1 cytochrome c oxidase subunit 4 [Sunxiuqinia elliptica]SFF63222.1 cytochrome c oxidase subunit 4 [Sunxiuqinia elliptica]